MSSVMSFLSLFSPCIFQTINFMSINMTFSLLFQQSCSNVCVTDDPSSTEVWMSNLTVVNSGPFSGRVHWNNDDFQGLVHSQYNVQFRRSGTLTYGRSSVVCASYDACSLAWKGYYGSKSCMNVDVLPRQN